MLSAGPALQATTSLGTRRKHHDTTSRCHLPFCWAHERSGLDYGALTSPITCRYPQIGDLLPELVVTAARDPSPSLEPTIDHYHAYRCQN